MEPIADLRLVTLADYEALIEFWKSCPGLTIGDSDRKDRFAIYLRRNPATNFLIEIGGRIVATALAGHDGRRGILRHVAVSAEHQRKGYAKLLVDRCTEALLAEGIDRSYAIVLRDNEDGLTFWRHTGWEYLDDCLLFVRGAVRENSALAPLCHPAEHAAHHLPSEIRADAADE